MTCYVPYSANKVFRLLSVDFDKGGERTVVHCHCSVPLFIAVISIRWIFLRFNFTAAPSSFSVKSHGHGAPYTFTIMSKDDNCRKENKGQFSSIFFQTVLASSFLHELKRSMLNIFCMNHLVYCCKAQCLF